MLTRLLPTTCAMPRAWPEVLCPTGRSAPLIVGMLYVYYLQNTEGLIATRMTSQIHDGLYLANLVFLVGVAVGP
ncbi:MAG: hypothetical protein IPK20_21580 [Betaproteobacteria bacterium]|nr:hypothetical protein [Betaproteobacteria bacterium]